MGSKTDNVAALLLAIYLIGVAFHKNGQKLADLLANETGFIKWAAAFGIIVFSVEYFKLGKTGDLFIGIIMLSMLLSAAGNSGEALKQAQDQIRQVFMGAQNGNS